MRSSSAEEPADMSVLTAPRTFKRRRREPQPDLPKSLQPSLAARVLGKSVMILVLFYFLAPIAWLIISSTKSNNQLYTSSPIAPGDQLVANYNALMAWTQGHFWRWVGNSVLYSTVAGVGGTLVSVAAGYGLAKFRIPGKGAIQGVVLAGLLMPIALLTVPLYLLFHSLGLVNTMWAIIIPSLVSPFGVFLGRFYVDSTVPDELLEAARLDGAGEVRIFFSIVLRLLAPAMVTIFLFIFVATWNNFLLPLMMISSPELKPVTLGLYGMMSYFNPVYGAVLQGALLGVIPLVILFLGLQRYWQAGLTSGSVKA
ncbi:MAG: carbohydrate ABC transporter permease [Actinomycetia bacterium]|nr:carbohydrate ABC transporter permease [Actinomycetes bacterium]